MKFEELSNSFIKKFVKHFGSKLVGMRIHVRSGAREQSLKSTVAKLQRASRREYSLKSGGSTLEIAGIKCERFHIWNENDLIEAGFDTSREMNENWKIISFHEIGKSPEEDEIYTFDIILPTELLELLKPVSISSK